MIMPPVGVALGGVDFSQLMYTMKPAVLGADGEVLKEAVAIRYGNFINNIISFVIVALSMFFIIKGMNKAKAADEEPEEEPETPRQEVLLEEIRNLLAK
jgi:large conductance mechanosensitive channel